MPSSMKRKLARMARLQGTFVTDGHQRIIDGVRFDILPLPAANCSNVKRGEITFRTPDSMLAKAYNATEDKRMKLIAEGYKPRTRILKAKLPEALCACGSCAWHFTTRGNFCNECGRS